MVKRLRCSQCGNWLHPFELYYDEYYIHIIKDIARLHDFGTALSPFAKLKKKFGIIPTASTGFLHKVPDTKMYIHTCFVVYQDPPGSSPDYFAAALPQSKDLHLYHGYDNFKDAAILFYNMTKRFAQ